jgi:Asp-tRNA(Asn)/Glu-tRNA(Gln) amidotransferase A subunit family amidase
VGKRFAEETILNLAYKFQQVTDYHRQKPQLK